MSEKSPAARIEPRLVSCPSCAKAAPWRTDNPYRPFCSARCKGIDFGAWAADEYRLPESTLEPPDDFS